MRSGTRDIEIEERVVSVGLGSSQSHPWPVAWSGVWIGTLTALAALLLFGLIAMAVGVHQIGQRIEKWSDFGLGALVLSVAGAFFSFVLAGWVAVKAAGIRESERGALHGAIVWLTSIPLVLLLASLGAGSLFGSWYGGLGGMSALLDQAGGEALVAIAVKNAALGAITALLLGLVGGVLGGWAGSGEPMSLTYRRE